MIASESVALVEEGEIIVAHPVVEDWMEWSRAGRENEAPSLRLRKDAAHLGAHRQRLEGAEFVVLDGSDHSTAEAGSST